MSKVYLSETFSVAGPIRDQRATIRPQFLATDQKHIKKIFVENHTKHGERGCTTRESGTSKKLASGTQSQRTEYDQKVTSLQNTCELALVYLFAKKAPNAEQIHLLFSSSS